jgi:hypothetical protein
MKRDLKRKWLIQGGLGSSLTGFGLCCLIEAGFLKHQNEALIIWVGAGTLALVITLSGINLLIGALEHKIKLNNLDD